MRRRVTTGYFEFYWRRYAPLINKIIYGFQDRRFSRDEMMTIAAYALLDAMAEYDGLRSSFVTFLHKKVDGCLANFRRDELYRTRHCSLDTPEFRAVLAVSDSTDPTRHIYLEELLSCLDPIKKQVMILTVGYGLSLRDAGKRLNIAHETVNRFKKEALAKIRHCYPETRCGEALLQR